MTQFKSEGQKPFGENKENDNSAASSAGEQTNIDQTGASDQDKNQTENKDGGEDNFADHPRWKEREDDWKNRFNDQEKRHTDEIGKLRQEFTQSHSKTEIPVWFGGDEEAWKAYSQDLDTRLTKIRQDTLNEIKTKSESEQKAIDDATNFFNSEVKAIESDKTLNPEGREVDRNKILKFALDNKLCDTEGKWNYRAAFKMMGADNVFKVKQALNEKKIIANAMTSDKHSESKPQAFATSEDFAKPGAKPW